VLAVTRHDLPAGIPCAVCADRAVRITGWTDDYDPAARPCGHRLSEIMAEGAAMARVEFGQYAESEVPKVSTGGHTYHLDADPNCDCGAWHVTGEGSVFGIAAAMARLSQADPTPFRRQA
jgi:hypothetical protein